MTTTPTLVGLVGAVALTVVSVLATPPHWHPWVQFVAVAAAVALIVARRRGRPLLTREAPARSLPVEVVDLLTAERQAVGCVEGDRVVTTAVELTAGALVATEVGEDHPADSHAVRVPLTAIADQLDQGGVVLEGIDVVTHGRRAATGPDGEVYSSLVGPLALISHRRVHLLLRFDLAGLALNQAFDTGAALERVVTTATVRVRQTLIHHGVPCRVLDAAELAERYLEAEDDPGEGTGLVIRPAADPRRVIDDLTAIRAATVTEVHRLRRVKDRSDVVDMVTTVGLTGIPDRASTDRVHDDTARTCHPLPSARVLPVPNESLPATITDSLVRRRIAHLDRLAPSAHGSGQILGATRTGNASALQLAGPHLRSVLLAARPVLCRQIAFRAVAAGYRVAVVTDVPDRWRRLLAIGDESRYRVIDPDASDAGTPVDLVVWDVDAAAALSEGRIDAFAGPGGPDVTPPTVIRVDADWGVRGSRQTPTTAPPDLVLDGRIDGWISVEPRGGDAHRVSVVTGPGEEHFTGHIATEAQTAPAAPAPGPIPADDLTPAGAEPSATPDRL